jgi:hypothetical protein
METTKKLVTFPATFRPVCRVCKQHATKMVVHSVFGVRRKYLLPCQHRLTPAHEEVIIRDMLKKGL